MSEPTIFTAEQLELLLKGKVSEKRFLHSKGVASCIRTLLEKYGTEGITLQWGNFDVSSFCGLSHDLAREFSDEEILDYCRENNIALSNEEVNAPLLAHGYVSASLARLYCGDYPKQWKRAIECHTTGNGSMDNLACALFIADSLEPTRTYLTDEKRNQYLKNKTIQECAYELLCDMMRHWKSKGNHEASKLSLQMKEQMEKEIGCQSVVI